MLSRAEQNLLRMQGKLTVNTTDAETVIPRNVMAIKWRAEQTTTIKDDAPVLSRAELQLRKLQGK
ncbi:hypothetical protein [Escherichia coli]|uniref:Uncharacterized protein n=1 Tax=Escherichia coli TaxID=562 RepID=A0A5P0JEV5_ECOLX|nr:hypothetical protein [Escherichia coli]MQK27261.1 hypothetical protein [Escherichia coli]OYJ73359.1 hypothetical protein CI668_12275 [Escherichia coli]HBN1669715.1 hypothetical protein [Escherichia coli]